MNITITNILNLNSMRSAKVIAGKNGLNRIVSSISVLESALPYINNNTTMTNENLSDCLGGEIVITGFLNIKDDSNMQYISIKHLIDSGEVGLILFYFGCQVKKIHKDIIDLCNDNNFPLIIMPQNRMDLRYSDVLGEVWNLIFNYRHSDNTSLVSELFERISRLTPSRRTVNNILKVLSDRIHSSLIICDKSFNVLNQVIWPKTLDFDFSKSLSYINMPKYGDPPIAYPYKNGFLLYRYEICQLSDNNLNLLIFNELDIIPKSILSQATEFVQLAINIWGNGHTNIAIKELVCSIIHDEPLKMKRLSDVFHVDISTINTMIIVKCPHDITNIEKSNLLDLATSYNNSVFGDFYESDFIIFMDSSQLICQLKHFAQELLSIVKDNSYIIIGNNLMTTSDMRQYYIDTQLYIDDIRTILPNKTIYNYYDILFSKRCRTLIDSNHTNSALHILSSINDKTLLSTLEIFLLDSDSNVTLTSEIMFVHKNTIKYRLHHISELLGFNLNQMPQMGELYTALSIVRLLRK